MTTHPTTLRKQFADRLEGKIRRIDRRNVRAAKRFFLNAEAI